MSYTRRIYIFNGMDIPQNPSLFSVPMKKINNKQFRVKKFNLIWNNCTVKG